MPKTQKNRILVNLILLVLTVFSAITAAKDGVNDISFYQPARTTESYPILSGSKVKNIIFCIGDGMGLAQVTLARLKAVGSDGTLYMEAMPIVGISRTHSANKLVTDSAAAATALATGIKTNNKMIGMTPNGKKYQTILEAAKNKAMATGLVATSTITHATPAAFGAHVKSRKAQDKIAEQLIANRINVLLGGGKQYFLPKTDPNSKRTDEKNLISQAKKAGYTYIETADHLKSAKGPYLLGLFQLKHLTTQPPEPTLAELTRKAIEVLNQSKGFFLMIEGSQIDWACHDNDINETIRQTLLFDQAVKVAIDFALKDQHTLVVVTADHETGGLTISKGTLDGHDLNIKWSKKGHTALPVPVYAFGPKADIFAGVYDNTDIPKKFAKLLSLKPFPKPAELIQLISFSLYINNDFNSAVSRFAAGGRIGSDRLTGTTTYLTNITFVDTVLD